MLRLAWSGLRHNTGRYVATLLAIMVGVAFFAATGFLGDRVTDALEGDTRRHYAGIDAVVAADDSDGDVGLGIALNVPASLADDISSIEGVDAAEGLVTGPVEVRSVEGSTVVSDVTGRRWITDPDLNPLTVSEGRSPELGTEIAIDVGVADDTNLVVGDTVLLLTSTTTVEVEITGLTVFGDSHTFDGGTISVAPDHATDLLSVGPPEFEQIYVKSDSLSQDDLTAAVSTSLPAGFEASTGDAYTEERVDSFGQVGRVLKFGLQGFAALALAVGGFVIFNTFSVLVAQRTRELAVLSAIGATPKQIRRSMRVEGLVVGSVGSALGVLLGVVLVLLLEVVLKATGVPLPGSGLLIRRGVVIQAILLGTIVTVGSALLPARRAARTEPMQALRDAAIESSPLTVARAVFAAVSVATGLFGLFVANSGWFLLVGVLAIFVGAIAAGPVIAVGASRVMRRITSRLGLEARLAADNIQRNPSRTAVTANALLIGVFLVTLVSVAGESVKSYVVGEIGKIESADFAVSTKAGLLDEDLVAEIEAVNGVETVLAFPRSSMTINDEPAWISAVDPTALASVTDIEPSSGPMEVKPGEIAIVDTGEQSVGDTVIVANPDGAAVSLVVTSVLNFSLDVDQSGSIVNPADYARIVPDVVFTAAFIDLEGSNPGDTEDLLREVLDRPDIELVAGNSMGRLLGELFDFVINAINGLLAMSVVVAVIGIVNTLTLAIHERRRELGLLRVVGMTDSRVRRMVRFEALAISLIGTLTGLVVGVLTARGVIGAIGRIGETQVPFDPAAERLTLVLLVGVVLGLVASLGPARRSTRLDVLDAIQAS